MSKMVKLFKEHCVLLMSIGLMVSGFIYLFYEIITAVIENVNQTTCFLLFKKVTYGLIKYSNITEYKYIDVIICYFEIFLIYVVMRELVAIVFGIIVAIIEQVLKLLQRVLFGEKHEKSLQYSTFQVWFLKVEADVKPRKERDTMKKQHTQKMTVRVTAQTAYNLERLMLMSGQKTPGRVVDKLVREKMLALRGRNIETEETK